MPTKIGMRVYQMEVYRLRDRKPLPFDTEGIAITLPSFVDSFITSNSGVRKLTSEEAESDRRWYFEPRQSNMPNNKGIVRYGMSGFESDLVNSKTNKNEFRRQIMHMEIIPLFYEFWFPPGYNHALAAFQSFASRSCIELISTKMQTDFANRNPGFSLQFRKLLPMGAGGIYDIAPVKGLRLIKRNASSDLADRYLHAHIGQAINFEIIINARRKGYLGRLGDLISSMKAVNGGVVQHDGVVFDKAVAEIEFGGRKRRVGIFGSNSEAGVIDLTDIKRASDGHPSFASISKASTVLLADFQTFVGKSKQS